MLLRWIATGSPVAAPPEPEVWFEDAESIPPEAMRYVEHNQDGLFFQVPAAQMNDGRIKADALMVQAGARCPSCEKPFQKGQEFYVEPHGMGADGDMIHTMVCVSCHDDPGSDNCR